MNTTTIQLELHRELFAAAAKIAARHRVSVGELMSGALEAMLEDQNERGGEGRDAYGQKAELASPKRRKSSRASKAILASSKRRKSSRRSKASATAKRKGVR